MTGFRHRTMIRLSHVRCFVRRAHHVASKGIYRTSRLRHLSHANAEGEAVRLDATLPLSLKGCLVQRTFGVSAPGKRFQACRSVDEVLFLTFDGDDIKANELIACLDALVRIQYNLLRAAPWAYYDSDLMLWVQSRINSEAEDYFRCLHRHHMFRDLLQEVDKVVDALSAEEAVTTLHSLLKLCVAKEHEVLLRLQEKSLQEYTHLDLKSLGLLSEAGNFMKRNGFTFNFLVCSLVRDLVERGALPQHCYHDLALVASNIAYFSSVEFMDLVLERAADMLRRQEEVTLLEDSLRYLEVAVKFATPDAGGPFFQHLLDNCDNLTIHQLCRLARVISFRSTNDPKKIVRREAMLRLDEGLLQTSDVVSLVGIFDAVGWSDKLRDEFLDLLSIHVRDFDTLLIKHFANSNFVTKCPDSKLMRQFANRWIQKLSEISESVSVLMTLVNTYNKGAVIPRYAQLVLQDKLVQEMQEGQLSVHPDKVVTCCHFLFKYGTPKSIEFAVRMLNRMGNQLTPRQIHSLQRAVASKKSLAQLYCLPQVWLQMVMDKKDQIQSLHIASCIFNNFYPAGSLLSHRDALTWSRILEDNSPFVTLAAFRSVLGAVTRHRLCLPRALESMVEYCLAKVRSFAVLSMLLSACAAMDFRPRRIEDLSALYVPQLLEDAEEDHFMKYAMAIACNLLKLDCAPLTLVQKIFSLDFLRRLDEETEGFVNTRTIDDLLFEVNRCTILQCPELDVPWLHADYKKTVKKTSDEDVENGVFYEIEEALKEILGGAEFVQAKSETPYLHTIDFEFYVSDSCGPITRHDAISHPEIPVRKLAVVLLRPEDFCSNVDRLVGSAALKLRHLEIMGYTVVKVVLHELPDRDSLREYLETKIFPRGHSQRLIV